MFSLAVVTLNAFFEPARRTTPLSLFEVQIANQAPADISLFPLRTAGAFNI